jgi:hypothetical protein
MKPRKSPRDFSFFQSGHHRGLETSLVQGLDLTNESLVRHYTDKVIEALGLPPERRGNVEADIRNEARIEAVQREYCKHLQPLQDKRHLLSPQTA